jgi:hypothetical protein
MGNIVKHLNSVNMFFRGGMKKKTHSKQTALSDLVSQAEAAKIRGTSRAAISQLIKRGRLQTVEVAGRQLLKKSAVEDFEAEAGGRGKRAQTVGPVV